MLGTNVDPFSNLHFNTIGKQPSLLARMSNAEDAEMQRTPSPSPSDASPLHMHTPLPESSHLYHPLQRAPITDKTVADSQWIPSKVHPPSVAQERTEASRVSRANGPLYLPLSNTDFTRTTQLSTTLSTNSDPPSSSTSSVHASSASGPRGRSIAVTKTSSGPSRAGPSNTLGLVAACPASFHPALSQSDDAIEAFRQMLTRLQTEADEFGRREEETRCAIAHQQDQAARWHARADAALESMKNLFTAAEQRVANAEQRAAQFAHLEPELALRDNELRETRASLLRLETENADLLRQFEAERNQADERRRSDEKRIDDAITKAAEALTKADNAMKQLESRNREHEIAESLMRKKAEEERTRSLELAAQLEQSKRQAAELQAELDEYKRLAEQEKERRMEELVEERRRLEERERLAQATSRQDNQARRDTSRLSKFQESVIQHTSASTFSVDSSAFVSEKSNAGSDPAARPHIPTSHEPLLAVKDDDTKTIVKDEQRSPILPLGRPQVDFEEQQADSLQQLAQEHPQTKHAFDIEPPIASTSTTLSSAPEPLHSSSSSISFGTGSPEPLPAYSAQPPEPFLSQATGPPGYNSGDVPSGGQSSTLYSQSIARPPPAPVLHSLVIPQQSGRPSRSNNSPSPIARTPLIRNRGNPQGNARRNDHYSPPPLRPEQKYGRIERYTSPVPRKHVREDDAILDRPDVHRRKTDHVVDDPRHEVPPPLAQRFSNMPPPHYDEMRQRIPDDPYSHSEPHRQHAYDRRDDDPRNNPYAQPARDGARTPPYPAGSPNNGYAVPGLPIVHGFDDTEARSLQMAPGPVSFSSGAYASASSGQVFAPGPAPHASSKKTAAFAARKPPYEQLSVTPEGPEKVALIERISFGRRGGQDAGEADGDDDDGTGGGATGSGVRGKRPARGTHQKPANGRPNTGKKGPRPQRSQNHQEGGRLQNSGAKGKPLEARIQPASNSLQDRLS